LGKELENRIFYVPSSPAASDRFEQIDSVAQVNVLHLSSFGKQYVEPALSQDEQNIEILVQL
jgi:hypothetical protein